MPTDRTNARKINADVDGENHCPVRRGPNGEWEIRGFAAAQSLLRSSDTVQAGLGVETVEKMPASIRRPVLYRDGAEHREHRKQTAKYFTPRRVDERYRPVMHRAVEIQTDKLQQQGEAHLAELSFHLAIDVACSVIGLTESRPGIQRRLERFFPEEFGTPGFTSLHGLYWVFRQARNWLGIYFADVRPAVRSRRRQRQDDVISHLIDEGCSSAEILGECITFAAAGMVTTREFINLAAWHLFTDEELLRRYRASDEPERIAMLHEILRLEPVVGHLRRRMTTPHTVPTTSNDSDGATPVTIPAGDVVDIALRNTNVDTGAVGSDPLLIHAGRTLASGVTPPGLSFGDGQHKCPGSHVAMLETDIFLTTLLALPGIRMKSPPAVSFNDAIGGYELRGLVVAVS